MRFVSRLGGILATIMGIVFLVVALVIYAGDRQLISVGVHAQGTVIDLKPSSSARNTTYAAIVQFKTSDGKLTQFTDRISQSPPAHQVNDLVDVIYDPANPSHAEIAGANNVIILALGGMGALLTLLGLGSVVRALIPKY
ncbi:MAG: DUF3592 domain-containing protein [Aggregatilineales bacterium]